MTQQFRYAQRTAATPIHSALPSRGGTRSAVEHRSRGVHSAGQGDGDAVAREGRDDRRLIADAE